MIKQYHKYKLPGVYRPSHQHTRDCGMKPTVEVGPFTNGKLAYAPPWISFLAEHVKP